MTLFGAQHQAIVEWLTGAWWTAGPSIAVVQGFPGAGKTEIALQAVARLKILDPTLPAVIFNCPESQSGLIDDLLLTAAEELATAGDVEILKAIEKGEETATILGRLLSSRRLIIVDEAQKLSIGLTGTLSTPIASVLERWSQSPNSRGRILLLSSREYENARWMERVEVTTLQNPEPAEAEAFLVAELLKQQRPESIPSDRLADVVSWLGCNPRAIRLLVSALGEEDLSSLIGLAPEAWEARDRQVSVELLHRFERAVLERAEDRLDARSRAFLASLSVLRQQVDHRGLVALVPEGSDIATLRHELIARFMIQLRGHHYGMHPILRDTVRSKMSASELRKAHASAGRYYAAAFRARQMVGQPEKLGARFVEARYHFTKAESVRDLAEISARFESHFRARFSFSSQVPADRQALDERITLLLALLQSRGPKSLEYHLARCLMARNEPGDVDRALPHARRATGPQSPADAWILRIQIEAQLFGSAAMTRVAREAVGIIPTNHGGVHVLYHTVAQILDTDGKPEDAVDFLRKGITADASVRTLWVLYHAAGSILASSGKADEAVKLLKEGIKAVPPAHNVFSLYHTAAEILAKDGKAEEAIELLQQGISVVPPFNVFSLYQAAAEILVKNGKKEPVPEICTGR